MQENAPYVIPRPTQASVAVAGQAERFPVRRIYCVARNYEAHAREMGFSEREQPFFFMKPADALIPAHSGETVAMPYPSMTQDLHHEVELVVALKSGGRNLSSKDALDCIYGYAVGLDMTRRDLQLEMKKQGRPWDIAKGFDGSAPIGPITPYDALSSNFDVSTSQIALSVNGQVRQKSPLNLMIWNIAEIIATLSQAWELAAGDLIFTGTPEGVASVKSGDFLQAHISGLEELKVLIGN